MQSGEGKPLGLVMKSKKCHSSVENFQKNLKVEQMILRDAFGWFCSAYLPDSIDACASAIIEPYHAETKQMTIILKGEYVRLNSQFKSVIVRQKFNMSLESSDPPQEAEVLSASEDSAKFLDYYNVEDVDITIRKPKDEDKKKKKTSFVENVTSLASHIQRFYVKNHFHWITGNNSTLVLGMKKRFGEVDCIFPTHFKNFEKCTFHGKIYAVVQQESLQIDVLDKNTKNLAEVIRHKQLFDHQKLRRYSKLKELLTENYLKENENGGCKPTEFFTFSGEDSDSEVEYYIIEDDSNKIVCESDYTSEEEFLVINKDGIIQYFSDSYSQNSDTEEDNVDSETEQGDAKAEVLEAAACVASKTKDPNGSEEEEKVDSTIQVKDEACGNASSEETKIEESVEVLEAEACVSSKTEDPNGSKKEEMVDSTIQVKDEACGNASSEESKIEESVEVLEAEACVASKTEDPKEEMVDSTIQVKDEACGNASSEESKIEESVDKPKNEELALELACNATSFLLFLFLYDEEHGTTFRKFKWEPLMSNNKVEGFLVTINGDLDVYVPYNGTKERTYSFLEVYKDYFKAKSALLEKANIGMAKLKRKFYKLTMPRSYLRAATPSKKEIAVNRKRAMDKVPLEGKKFNFPLFGRKEDRKSGCQKKIIKPDGSSSSSA